MNINFCAPQTFTTNLYHLHTTYILNVWPKFRHHTRDLNNKLQFFHLLFTPLIAQNRV